MHSKPTQAHVRTIERGIIIDLAGDLNSQGEKTIRDAFQHARQILVQGALRPNILFNLANTDYINTSGIAVLISLVMQAEKEDVKISLFGASPHYQKIFKLVRLPLYAQMFNTEEQALAAIAQT